MLKFHLPLGLRVSELMLLGAGICLLLSLLLIKQDGNFFIWYIAKGLYGLGVFLFIFNR